MYSFFVCAFWQKRQKNARSLLLFPCVVKSPPQQKCDVLKCKKTRALPFFFPHISTLCSSKRPAKKSDVCGAHVLLFFFHHISTLCSSKRPAEKKNVTYLYAKKCACSPFFFLISVRCAVLKDPPK